LVTSPNNTPLVKEYRINKILECLKCIDAHKFDRDRQRQCILEIYPGKKEKSVFRGMVIPSLRDLGLIIGYSDFIRLSANGKLLLESTRGEGILYSRVLSAIIFEIDRLFFRFLEIIHKYPDRQPKAILYLIANNIIAPSPKQKNERIKHWLSMLKEAQLLTEESFYRVNAKIYDQAIKDLNMKKKRTHFKQFLFDSYFGQSENGGEIVDIADLRESVALRFLSAKDVVTELQFDDMLRELPFNTKTYIIALGSPIGSGALFSYKGQEYRTLAIRMLRR